MPTASPPRDPSALPDAVWDRLRAPFTFGDLLVADLLVDPFRGGGTGRPTLRVGALVDRLDDVLGPEGWDADVSASGRAVRCRLRIGSACRTGLAEAADPGTAVADALRQAAALFGIGRGLAGTDVLAFATDAGGAPDWDAARAALVERGAVAP